MSKVVSNVIGIYSDPGHVIEYTSDGEVRQEFTIVFVASVTGGAPTLNAEASEVVWIDPDSLDDYPITASVRKRIEHYRSRSDWPIIV